MDLIRSEIRRFTSEPVTADELSDSQANFIGRLPLSLESNGGVAGALLNLERYDLGLDYYRRYPDLVRRSDNGTGAWKPPAATCIPTGWGLGSLDPRAAPW